MKRISRYLPFLILFFCAPWARAQGSFDLALGFGTAHDKATGAGIDANSFTSCTPSASDTTCEATPSLGGLLMGFEGDAMLNNHFGFGGELKFQPGKSNYGPLEYRELFYDFDGLYAPINHKRFQVRIEGGIGAAHSGFSYSQTACVGTAVCTTELTPVGTANHFQVRVGAGVQIYVRQHIFVRPEFDFHEVPGLTNQFGTNRAIGGTVWVGYNFGEM